MSASQWQNCQRCSEFRCGMVAEEDKSLSLNRQQIWMRLQARDSCEVGLIDTSRGCQDSACGGGSRIPGVQVFKCVFVHSWRHLLQRHALVFFGGAIVLWVLGCGVPRLC